MFIKDVNIETHIGESNSKRKKVEVPGLTSDKIYFKTKNVFRDRGAFHIDQVLIH